MHRVSDKTASMFGKACFSLNISVSLCILLKVNVNGALSDNAVWNMFCFDSHNVERLLEF
jgi:hypothetical protein